MATYLELTSLFTEQAQPGQTQDLLDKVMAAVMIGVDSIRAETTATSNHDARVTWGKEAAADPRGKASEMLPLVLAANKTATVNNITGASDTAIQSNVDDVINFFAV